MNIVCVMPIFGRPAITLETIGLLRDVQTLILVGSGDCDEAVAKHVGAIYLEQPNQPLGNKVQAGVDYAREFSPDALLLTGSDSWLSANWCKTMYGHIERGVHFVGTAHLFVCNLDQMDLTLCSYRARRDSIGAGRMFSTHCLDAIDWKLFPHNVCRGLDSQSDLLVRSKIMANQILILTDLSCHILEVKSCRWDTMTTYERIISSAMICRTPIRPGEPLWPEVLTPSVQAALTRLLASP